MVFVVFVVVYLGLCVCDYVCGIDGDCDYVFVIVFVCYGCGFAVVYLRLCICGSVFVVVCL